AHDLRGIFSVFHQHGYDLIDRYGVVMRMPAVVIGDHRDCDIVEFGFAREFRFLQVGHVDHIHSESAINVRFGSRRELRAFHAEIGVFALVYYTDLFASGFDDSRELSADGIGEGNMSDDPVSEERVDAMASAVKELVRDYELERLVL